jgi:hypothetical protein
VQRKVGRGGVGGAARAKTRKEEQRRRGGSAESWSFPSFPTARRRQLRDGTLVLKDVSAATICR